VTPDSRNESPNERQSAWMSKLSALFSYPLDHYLFAKMKTEKEIIFNTRITDFEVEIQLLPYKKGLTVHCSDEEELTYCISDIVVLVSRDLSDEIPPVIKTDESEDYIQRGTFFLKYMRDYQNTALQAINRTLKYFKYVLKNPMLEQIPYTSPFLFSARWLEENGDEIKTGVSSISIKNPPGLGLRDFGVTPLTRELEPEAAKAIANELKPELYEELLADAHSAIFHFNYRRAVLEMAMACELVIKQTYFSTSTAAGRAYEFMEDRQKVSINITDYIDAVAEYALGEGFQKVSSKGDFINIQHLFRGRNKIAHRGELSFRDDGGKVHPIDYAVLKRWWISVERLLAWLYSKKTS